MTTLMIEVTNEKALKLLQDLEDLKIIRVVKSQAKLSSLRGKFAAQLTNDEIDNQINKLREEWQRDI